MMDAVSKNSKWFDDAVNAKVERAMARFDVAASEGGLKILIDEKAKEAVNGFIRRTLADEAVPSSSAAAAIARLTAEEIAARASAQAGRKAAKKGGGAVEKAVEQGVKTAGELGFEKGAPSRCRLGFTLRERSILSDGVRATFSPAALWTPLAGYIQKPRRR
jgi:hypothetical protein